MLEYEGVVSSRLSEVEVARTVARERDARLLQTIEEVFEAIVFTDVTRPIVRHAAGLQPRELRSLDAIHVATALSLNISDLDFITYDKRLARAARAHGLTCRP